MPQSLNTFYTQTYLLIALITKLLSFTSILYRVWVVDIQHCIYFQYFLQNWYLYSAFNLEGKFQYIYIIYMQFWGTQIVLYKWLDKKLFFNWIDAIIIWYISKTIAVCLYSVHLLLKPIFQQINKICHKNIYTYHFHRSFNYYYIYMKGNAYFVYNFYGDNCGFKHFINMIDIKSLSGMNCWTE